MHVQSTLDDLGTPLREVTFVVVDLETTGGSPASSAITEIGAVKVRGGEVIGEFQSLVNPGCAVPPFIALLTGITDSMLAGAPSEASVLPAFLEFAHGAVLVAHNAPFDIGFLTAACERLGIPWPRATVVDTVKIARSTLPRDEVPNCKLATLAAHFRVDTTPTHRALDDARATVGVLHALLERLGRLGVQSLEELTGVSRQVTSSQRRKRHLADHLPDSPGVYIFRDASGRVLYIGTSRRVRTRVRSYFTASEQRRRMAEMVALTDRVDAIECASAVEAAVRELRLISEHRPPYNRRSKNPERVLWLKLTIEPFPRLSIVRGRRDDTAQGSAYLGPFTSKPAAERAAEALLHAIPLRTCTARISASAPKSTACALADMGRCGAPCDGRQSVSDYAVLAEAARHAMTGSPDLVIDSVRARIDALVLAQRFEDAALWRDRLASFVRGAARQQRLDALNRAGELVAAERTDDGGWVLHVIRGGRLAAAALAPRGRDPYAVLEAAALAADTQVPSRDGAAVEESEVLLRWLESEGVRPVRVSGTWASEVDGAARRVAQVSPRIERPELPGSPAAGWTTLTRPVMRAAG